MPERLQERTPLARVKAGTGLLNLGIIGNAVAVDLEALGVGLALIFLRGASGVEDEKDASLRIDPQRRGRGRGKKNITKKNKN